MYFKNHLSNMKKLPVSLNDSELHTENKEEKIFSKKLSHADRTRTKARNCFSSAAPLVFLCHQTDSARDLIKYSLSPKTSSYMEQYPSFFSKSTSQTVDE